VAKEMGMSLKHWRRVQVEPSTIGLVSATPNPDRGPDRMCEQHQLKNTLAKAVGKLPERYQKVGFQYHTNEMTMKEIGDVLGVNESRVSQIHKIALKKMATVLNDGGIRSAQAL
jgi:RNA polymerase sigma factor for flagellar operon FliA